MHSQPSPLVLTPLAGFPLVHPGDNLAEIVWTALIDNQISLQDGDILILAQKIVSKAENRLVHLSQVVPSPRAVELAALTEKDPRMVELVLRESHAVLRCRPGTIIVEHRLGFVCANAGIDHSNVEAQTVSPGDSGDRQEMSAEEWVLLLPENPDRSAEQLRHYLQERSGVRLGVLIIDSHGRAWRLGTVGVTIGLAGLPGLVDLRGEPDLFGYRLRITEVGAGDELAAAASLVMGQAAEGTPLVHGRGFPYGLREGDLGELIRPRSQDLFR
jgi:coenzyme F420-0:L-glutamate ligase/coenzyme F420-1:gamma-L-glutamate ligase